MFTLTMSENDLTVLKKSSPLVLAHIDEVVKRAYDMFEKDENMRPEWVADRAERESSLKRLFTYLIDSLDDLPTFTSRFRELGLIHHRVGMPPELIKTAEGVFVTAMAYSAGPNWSDEYSRSWSRLFHNGIGIMAETIGTQIAA